jgi:digeranylgeranylglycerophospholipid reductase
MASQCIAQGTVVRYDARVTDVGPDDGSVRLVRFANGASVSAHVVIDASGPISSFGKKENILSKAPDLEPAYFTIAGNTGIENDAIHVYLGRKIAPGGYAWAFPREDGTTNVGIVLGKAGKGKHDIRMLLDTFMKNTFPDAHAVSRHAGAIPCETGSGPIALSRLIKAGDAASTVNPVTRAGITEALLCGALAGEFGIAMLHSTSEKQTKALCSEYRNAWHDSTGRKHGRLSRVKDALARIPDADYNTAFAALSQIRQDKLTTARIIKLSLGRFPRLVFAMRHLM